MLIADGHTIGHNTAGHNTVSCSDDKKTMCSNFNGTTILTDNAKINHR